VPSQDGATAGERSSSAFNRAREADAGWPRGTGTREDRRLRSPTIGQRRGEICGLDRDAECSLPDQLGQRPCSSGTAIS
jgi:hypothetical protein